ncbi:heterokaryon incompatibility protein-domain-containing protein [Xylariales sp. AK1849]|nr:heterokaryon incompatibility protein-domain-containing protein [Xylariales sp. AK1849]
MHLCLNCRKAGHSRSDCTSEVTNDIDQPNGTSIDRYTLSEITLRHSQSPKSGDLCERCAAYDILNLLSAGDIKDELSGSPDDRLAGSRGNDSERLDLGAYDAIILDGSCPLCRLIFRIFPSHGSEEGQEATRYSLRPMRSYNRLGIGYTLSDIDDSIKKKYAIYVSVQSRESEISVSAQHMGDPAEELLHKVRYSFSLSNVGDVENRRPGLCGRPRDAWIDPELLKGWLDRCIAEHGPFKCSTPWSDQLLKTRMIDVATRSVVKYPPQCSYVALSYVWGGVSPKEDALANNELPQTIEDAITATKMLGIPYLWVDALCIDQRPTPEKIEQLGMMDVIYNSARATLIALHGDDADAGLCGVSRKNPRTPQGRENIGGSELLTLFPTLEQELGPTKYQTRAWTFQEMTISQRRIFFGKHQVHFVCGTGNFCESIDDSWDPADILKASIEGDAGSQVEALRNTELTLPENAELRRKAADFYYRKLLDSYTSRQMTNEGDSLNAYLGVLENLRKYLLPEGFVCGLPLVGFPQALRWYHPRWVKPRRRPNFPSWSWAGWEGQVLYTEPLDLVGAPDGPKRHDKRVDMSVRYLGVNDKMVTLEGSLLTLEIRNEPFNDAYIPRTDVLVGIIQQGNVLHKNTLPAGVFTFLVIERLQCRFTADGHVNHTLFMIMLVEETDGMFSRKTMVRLYVDRDFASRPQYLGLTQGSQKIRLV